MPTCPNGTHLSPRQYEVMQLLTAGQSIKGVARTLGIAVGTVAVHVAMAYAALGVHNRVEAVVKAGLFTSGE